MNHYRRAETCRRVACIGAGLIGGGWAAHFLARGLDVSAWDPAPDAPDRVRTQVDAAWPSLEKLGLAPGADRARLVVAPTLEDALKGADFVQESAPERLEVKRDLLRRMDAALPSDVVIASSTSGLMMTDMQAGLPGARRMVIGHPMNPSYLMPLVEVVGGEASDPAAVGAAAAFYTASGKVALELDREYPGFLVTRLQEALLREAMHLVASGEASVAQIDRTLAWGAGLRWALVGPWLSAHLSGGEGGIGQYFRNFDSDRRRPWARLEMPEFSEPFLEKVRAGALAEADGRPVAHLVAERDRFIVELLKLKARLGGLGAKP